MTSPQPPVWLITGCSTGFGRELAKQVLARGWRAVVTARDTKQVEELVANSPERARAVALDVTNAEQIAAAVKATEHTFGQIDVLVNNAGRSYLSSIEEGEESSIRRLFETNFFGPLALIRTVLPLMRARRQGHIVNFSSIGGLAAFPASGFYAATKFALEGLSEALAPEVGPLGIRVTLVEPGPFRTGMALRAEHAPSSIPDYEATVGQRRQQFRNTADQFPGDPVRGAEAVIRVTEMIDPPLRLILGSAAYEVATRRFKSVLEEFARWESVARGADYGGVGSHWSSIVRGTD